QGRRGDDPPHRPQDAPAEDADLSHPGRGRRHRPGPRRARGARLMPADEEDRTLVDAIAAARGARRLGKLRTAVAALDRAVGLLSPGDTSGTLRLAEEGVRLGKAL